MSSNHTKVMLVTANVGSIFEDPDNMLQLWLVEFLAAVKKTSPGLLAIHCQEVGGKDYETSMQHVDMFVEKLLASETLQQYDKVRVLLDEDFSVVDQFTALGNLYFIHQSIKDVQIWDFMANEFIPAEGRKVHSGNIEKVSYKEKAKFPIDLFPNHKWSRKGFLRTRWNLCNTQFDLVNVHLFHDASNIVAMESSPSEYSTFRRNALNYTINRFEEDDYSKVPYFIFGDFNFRLGTGNIIRSLTEKLQEHKLKGKKGEIDSVTYTEHNTDKVVLSVEKKGFEHRQHSEIFSSCSEWLRGFDFESGAFADKLVEYPVTFPPSYPFSEDVADGKSYMKTRCPSWCDRVMLTTSAKQIISESSPPEYGMIGSATCMGDHKPISLTLRLKHHTDSNMYHTPASAVSTSLSEGLASNKQIRITEIETTKYVHVRQNGASVRIFRETSV